MNPFWNKIVMTLALIAAIVSARYASAWVANHTWRAERYQASLQPRPVLQPAYVSPSRPAYAPMTSTPGGREYARRWDAAMLRQH